MAKNEFGDVCPVLRVAKKYNVPYENALVLADYVIHHRHPVGFGLLAGGVPNLPVDLPKDPDEFEAFMDDLGRVGDRLNEIRNGAAY